MQNSDFLLSNLISYQDSGVFTWVVSSYCIPDTIANALHYISIRQFPFDCYAWAWRFLVMPFTGHFLNFLSYYNASYSSRISSECNSYRNQQFFSKLNMDPSNISKGSVIDVQTLLEESCHRWKECRTNYECSPWVL